MSGVASRYQNSLIYDPSLSVGRYPERSAYTMPHATLGATMPFQFQPAPELAPTVGTAYGLSASGGSMGDVNMPAGAGFGVGLISPALKGLQAGARGLGNASQTDLSGINPTVTTPYVGIGTPVADTIAAYTPGAPETAIPGGQYGGMPGGQEYGGEFAGQFAPGADFGGAVGGAGGGFSAAPVDALSDFGGGAETALANMMGPQGASEAAAGGFNPYGMGAGIVGGYLGNMAGTAAFGPGDAQQRPWTSGIGAAAGGLGGGILAGAIGGSSFGPVGTLIGAFAGAFLGAGAGGSPDLPLGYFGGSVGSDGQFHQDDAGALNGGRRWQAQGMSNSLFDTLTQRAAADGLHVNPGFVNQQVFNAGFSASLDDPSNPYFYNVGNRPAAASEKDFRTGDYGTLADFAYGDLTGRGVFTAGGPSWADVQTNLQGQGDAPEQLFYGGESGGQTGQIAGHGWQQNQYMVDGSGLTAPDLSAMGVAPMLPGSYVYGNAPSISYASTSPDMGNSG